MAYFSGALEIASDSSGPGDLFVFNNIILQGGTPNKTTLITTCTSDIAIELPYHSDKLLGTFSSDVLYNKTIIDPSNIIYARGFIDIDGNIVNASSNKPSDAGYMLISISVSDTEWKPISDVMSYLVSDIASLGAGGFTSDIASLKSDIALLQVNVENNDSDIALILSDLSSVISDTAQNTSDIHNWSLEIASNTSDIYSNLLIIQTHTSDIAHIKSDIAMSISDIAGLATGSKGFTDYVITVGPADQSDKVDYTTIKSGVVAANALAASGKRVTVNVTPGLYAFEKNPININSYVTVTSQGTAIATIVIPSDKTTHVFEVSEESTLDGFMIMGANGVGGKAIYFDGTGTFGRCLVTMCAITNCTTGIYATGGKSILLVREMLISTKDSPLYNVGTAIHATNGAQVRITDIGIYGTENTYIGTGARIEGSDTNVMLGTCFIERCNTGVYLNNSAEFLLKADVFNKCGTAILLGSDGYLQAISNEVTIVNSSDYDLVISSSDSLVKFFGTELCVNKVQNNYNAKLDMTYYSKQVLDSGFNVLGELHVGTPAYPTESCFGEGDCYISGMSVQTNTNSAAGTWSIISSDKFLGVNSFKVFPSDTVNNAIYVGGDFQYHGIKYGTVNGVTSDITMSRAKIQQWTGTTWDDITYMVSKAEPPYWTYSKSLFNTAGQEDNVRYRNRSSWTKSTLNGINKYWSRIILTSDLDQSPTLNYIKLHSSRKEINSDGFVEYFGNSRPYSVLPFHFGLFGTSSSEINTGDQDLFLTKDIFMGIEGNTFPPVGNKDTRLGASLPLPPELDTSFPVKAQFIYMGDGLMSGNVPFIMSLGASFSGTNIQKTSVLAPSDTVYRNSKNTLIAFTGMADSFTQKQFSLDLDLSSIKSNPSSDLGGFIWFTAARASKTYNTSDSYTGTVNMLGVKLQYVKWSDGGHIAGYASY